MRRSCFGQHRGRQTAHPPRHREFSGGCNTMSEECNHDCSSCKSKCDSAGKPRSFLLNPREGTSVKKVIAVVSGKGGVGKSLITSLLAAKTSREGRKTAILDADITGPSIPRSFGVADEKVVGVDGGMLPVKSKGGISIMSLNLLMEHETDPVIWRGPVIAGTVKQFWTDVIWNEVDRMFVDMPPGTGDVPLTVFQSIPVDGIVIVTSPQELVGMIVEKAVNMAKMMNIPVLGIVENMSGVLCPHCGGRIEIFGKSHVHEAAEKLGIKHVAQVPMDPGIAAAVDAGKIEDLNLDCLNEFFDGIDGELK